MGDALRPRLAVLFSGGGRTLENLAASINEGSLVAEIALALASRSDAGGIARAERLALPVAVVDHRASRATFDDDVLSRIDDARVDWVILAGYLRRFPITPRYAGRVINIHPSLLPAHGGPGYYGDRVHRAVLAAGDRVSGCTVHFVDEEYDRGPIILQRVVPVAPDDSPESLAARVFEAECVAYPEALRLVLGGAIRVGADGCAVVRGEPPARSAVSR